MLRRVIFLLAWLLPTAGYCQAPFIWRAAPAVKLSQPPSIDGTGEAANAAATSISLSISSGKVQPGDWLIVVLAKRCEHAHLMGRFYAPETGGWVVAEQPEVSTCDVAGTGVQQVWFMRHADASDVSLPSYTFNDVYWASASATANSTESGVIDGMIFAVSGVNPQFPIDADGHMGTYRTANANTTTNMPFAYASNAMDLRVSCVAVGDATSGATPGTPAGFTAVVAAQSNTNGTSQFLSQGCYYKTAGMVGWVPAITGTQTSGNAVDQAAQTVLFLPTNGVPFAKTKTYVGGNFPLVQETDPPITAGTGGSGGTDYYLDNSVGGYNGQFAPSGNCATNDGHTGTSQATAWCTIQKLNSVNITGPAAIHFKCGDTWNEQLIPCGPSGQCPTGVGAQTVTPDSWILYTTGANSGSWTGCTGLNDAVITGADTIGGANATNPSFNSGTLWTLVSGSIYKTNIAVGSSDPHVGYPHIDAVYVGDDMNPTCSPNATPGCPSSDTGRPLQGLVRAADLPSCSSCGTAPGTAVAWANDGNYDGAYDASGTNASPITSQASNGSADIQKMTAGSYVFYPVATTAPADLTAGVLYVWLGDGSNPNNHTILGDVRDWAISSVGNNSGYGPSWVWFRGFGMNRADGGIGSYCDRWRDHGCSHWIIEYHTAAYFGGRTDAGSDYHAGISVENSDHILLRHNVITYSGQHGNPSQYQACWGCMVEYDDHSYGLHNTDDSKASDYMVFRYLEAHDGVSDSLASQTYNGGIYLESGGTSDLNPDAVPEWGSPSPPYLHYQNVSWHAYWNTVWNTQDGTVTGSGGNPGDGAACFHIDQAPGPGLELLNNTCYSQGASQLGSYYNSVGTAAGPVINLYCNVASDIATSTVCSAHASSACNAMSYAGSGGTLNEGSNNWGRRQDGTKSPTSGFTAAGTDFQLDPIWNGAAKQDFRWRPGASPGIGKCATANGLESYQGAWAPATFPKWGSQ